MSFKKKFKRDWRLHLMILLPVVYMLIFHYYPMYGVQIAFRDFNIRAGITGSEWVGLKWFEKFVTNINFSTVFFNTLYLALYGLIVSFPLPIILALILNSLPGERFKKVVQSVAYVPHFISVVVLVAMFNHIFSPVNGLYRTIYRLLGNDGYPTDFRSISDSFRHIYVWTGIWQNVGWSSIIYTAALSSVSQELHEAAHIDGANRLQRIRYVDIPAILPTICIMLILSCGSIMSISFDKAYLLQTDLNRQVSEVISTYVYKVGLGRAADFSYGAAVGLFNSVINCTMLLLVNGISNKLSNKEVGLF